jgi:hypothetical protein
VSAAARRAARADGADPVADRATRARSISLDFYGRPIQETESTIRGGMGAKRARARGNAPVGKLFTATSEILLGTHLGTMHNLFEVASSNLAGPLAGAMV